MRERRRYHEPRRYAAQRQRQGRRSSSAPGYLLSACLIGALAGGGWSLTDPDRRQAFVANASDVAVEVGIMRERAPQEGDYWRQCRSEEHTSELQSLMRISYAVFCLKKKTRNPITTL